MRNRINSGVKNGMRGVESNMGACTARGCVGERCSKGSGWEIRVVVKKKGWRIGVCGGKSLKWDGGAALKEETGKELGVCGWVWVLRERVVWVVCEGWCFFLLST